MFIAIDDLLTLYNYDVFVKEGAADATPERLLEAVKLAFQIRSDEFYPSVVCGQVDFGLLAERSEITSSEITSEEFFWLKREYEIAEAGRIAKGKHTIVRRKDFGARRSQLALAMIDAGVPHRCAFPGCEEIHDLTVDHIRPLSRGGDDGLANLQFLCRSHNSAKGDKHDR